MSKSSKYKYQVLERDGKDEGVVALNKIQSPHPGPTTGEGGNEGNGGTSNPKEPKSPPKPLEERIAGVIKGLVPEMINVALKPVVNHLEHIDSRLDKQDEFNQYVRNVFERNNLK